MQIIKDFHYTGLPMKQVSMNLSLIVLMSILHKLKYLLNWNSNTDLNLLDKFLFAKAIEDAEIMELLLGIILGNDVYIIIITPFDLFGEGR